MAGLFWMAVGVSHWKWVQSAVWVPVCSAIDGRSGNSPRAIHKILQYNLDWCARIATEITSQTPAFANLDMLLSLSVANLAIALLPQFAIWDYLLVIAQCITQINTSTLAGYNCMTSTTWLHIPRDPYFSLTDALFEADMTTALKQVSARCSTSKYLASSLQSTSQTPFVYKTSWYVELQLKQIELIIQCKVLLTYSDPKSR